MRQWLSSFWENYKYRFVPWIILNLKQKKQPVKKVSESSSSGSSALNLTELNLQEKQRLSVASQGPMIVHHVNQGDDKLLSDEQLVDLLISLCEQLLELEKAFSSKSARGNKVMSAMSKELMHQVLGYSVERRKSHVSADAGTGVFLASGHATPGSLIALYPGTIYLPSEPLFFPSLGNPFIFRCSDNVHIDGNDKWISKSIYKSCAARDKFRADLPCCDETWITSTPINPLNVGQYVNNRSKSQDNNVVYQESQIIFAAENAARGKDEKGIMKFPVHLCKYLPNVWSNPENNHLPFRLVPLVAVKDIREGDEILSSYFTVVHAGESQRKDSGDSKL